jgi:RHS repeat-associated protein
MRIAMRVGNTLYYLHGDHLASTSLATDSAGGVGNPVRDQDFYAYGRYRRGGTLPTDHKFTGQKLNGSGLYYYGARYYDPQIGLFLSPDSLIPDPASIWDYNRLMYTRGNPLKFIDPSGHFCVPVVNLGTTCNQSTNEQDGVVTELLGEEASDLLFEQTESLQQYYEEYIFPFSIAPNPVLGIMATQFDWTVSADLGGFAAPTGAVGRGSVSLALDHEGTIALIATGGTGGSTPMVVPLGLGLSMTNASSVLNLAGDSIQIGGTVGEGVNVLAEGILFKDSETGELYGGTSLSAGVALPNLVPGSIHATWERSHIVFQANPFDAVMNATQRFWFGRDQ